MATHSSVLAWRITGTAEPGGLPTMGSQSWTRRKRLSSSSSSSSSSMCDTISRYFMVSKCDFENHMRLWFPPRYLVSFYSEIIYVFLTIQCHFTVICLSITFTLELCPGRSDKHHMLIICHRGFQIPCFNSWPALGASRLSSEYELVLRFHLVPQHRGTSGPWNGGGIPERTPGREAWTLFPL